MTNNECVPCNALPVGPGGTYIRVCLVHTVNGPHACDPITGVCSGRSRSAARVKLRTLRDTNVLSWDDAFALLTAAERAPTFERIKAFADAEYNLTGDTVAATLLARACLDRVPGEERHLVREHFGLDDVNGY